MDTVGLQYFISTARYLNFTKAAEECCITQTAMSLHIAKLEKELDFKLFERGGRSVSLTPGGKAFYEEACRILRLYNDGVRKAARAAAGISGSLSIGFTNFVGRLDLPELVRQFHEAYPLIHISLVQKEQGESIEEIKYGYEDVALLFPYDTEEIESIRSLPYNSYPFRVFLHRAHPLANLNSICLEQIQGEQIIINSRDEMPYINSKMRRDWESCAFTPRRILEAKGVDTILFMVEAGFGLALLPEFVDISSTNLKRIPIRENALKIAVSLMYLEENKNPCLDLFLDFSRKWLSPL